jgi:hypothetical protein
MQTLVKGELAMSAERLVKGKVGLALSALAVALTVAFVLPARVLAADAPNVARISSVVDNAFVLGKDDVEWGYAEPNLIVEEGDLLQTNETGRAEVQFDPKLLLRIGEGTRIAVIEMDQGRVVGMDGGRLYFRISDRLSPNEALTLTFPSGQLHATERALVRVDMLEGGKADVKVVRGAIDIEAMASPRKTLHAGERVIVSPEGKFEFAAFGPSRGDGFDAWNEQRDIALSTYKRPSQLSQNIVGQEDLNGYGTWVYNNQYNSYAWQPYVAQSWRPYSYGYWVYSGLHGWTWVPYEPWGYATYHYGAWVYDPYYGWLWVPGYTWRPAYVNWVGYGDYVGWVPVDPYGYPVITTYPYYVPTVFVSHVDLFSFTFVHRRHFHDHHGRHDFDDDDDHGHRDHDHDFDHDDNNNNTQPLNTRSVPLSDFRTISGTRVGGDPVKGLTAADLGKIEKGKLRFVKDSRELGIEKSLRKGESTRGKADFQRMLDVNKHPELKERVARIEASRSGNGKVRAASLTTALPRKREGDRARTLDFRKFVNERREGSTVARGQTVEQRAPVFNVDRRGEDRRQTTAPIRALDQRIDNSKRGGREDRVIQRLPENIKGEDQRSIPTLIKKDPAHQKAAEGAFTRADRLQMRVTDGKKGEVKVFRSGVGQNSIQAQGVEGVFENKGRSENLRERETRELKDSNGPSKLFAQPNNERLLRGEGRTSREVPQIPTVNIPTVAAREALRRNESGPREAARPEIMRGREIVGVDRRPDLPRETDRRNERLSQRETRITRESLQDNRGSDRREVIGRGPIPAIPRQQPQPNRFPQMEARQIAVPAQIERSNPAPMFEQRLMQAPQRMETERPDTKNTRFESRVDGREFSSGSRFETGDDSRGSDDRRGGFSSGRGGRGRR